MINRFKVKVNEEVKQFKELDDATKYIGSMEQLGYNCELFFVTIGLYEEHIYSLYSTLEKDNIKANLKRIGVM